MVKVPVVTTLAIEEPEITPVAAEASTGCLGRTAAQVAEQRDRRLDEVVAGTGGFQQRAEQHEQKDEAGRDAECDAEYTLGGQPQVRHALAQRRTLVRDHVGHVGTEENVADEGQCEDDHRQPKGAARGFKQQHECHLPRQTGPACWGCPDGWTTRYRKRKGRTAQKNANGGKYPVHERNAVARRALEAG